MRLPEFIAFLLISCALRAEEIDKPLEIELISEVGTICAGKPFFLGLHLKHPPGTHTYWKNPGIVGISTSIEWELPLGFHAGEIQWPAPKVVKMGGHDAQGYEGETLLMIPITPPAEIAGASVKITAKASWMCCGIGCHPATNIPFAITLPVGDITATDSASRLLFKKFRSQIPKAESSWKEISAKREGGKIIVTLDPVFRQPDPFLDPANIRFFTADGQVNSERKQEVSMTAQGVIVMTLDASETAPKLSKSLPGVVVIPTGKTPRLIEVDPLY